VPLPGQRHADATPCAWWLNLARAYAAGVIAAFCRFCASAARVTAVLACLLPACPACRKTMASDTAIIVGIQSEPMGGIASSEHIVVRVGGVVTSDEMVKPPNGDLMGFPRPWERRVKPPSDDPDAQVDVEVDTVGPQGPVRGPHLNRRASTHFQAGHTELLRVVLESRCVVYPVPTRGREHGSIPGPLSGPTCAPPSTCIRGLCQTPLVPLPKLEPYAVDWPNNAPDLCRPRNAGAPTVQLGTGQTGYTPLTGTETLQAEAGPQGGHHIWIAVRMKNMKQAGSTTRVSAVQPDTGTVIPSSTFAFTFERDEGGYCKLYGLRYQLDNGGIDYTQFLGKPLDVTTTVVDGAQATASSTVRIQVAPTLRNP